MKFKTFIIPLILLLAGAAMVILGTLFKIMHWQFAGEVLTVGMVLEVIALIGIILKLIKVYNTKD